MVTICKFHQKTDAKYIAQIGKYGSMRKLIAKLKALLLYPLWFGKYGSHSLILHPLQIDGAKNIQIGKRVYIQSHSWLAAMPLTGKTAELLIGNGCSLGHFNHIYATQSIVLENDVLTADKVYISDNQHTYTNVEVPIKEQSIKQDKPVRIGQGSWLGENVCVIGANIGKHCVIGANSVVTKDIPDYSVAVGAPAKVIKQYNATTNQWEKV